LLNGKRCNIGSVIVNAGDVIQLREKAKQMPSIIEGIGSVERDVPEYIEADHDKMSATFLRIPTFDEVPYPVQMEPNLVIEYYSR
jgi:small subunit ribosomal protein S4